MPPSCHSLGFRNGVIGRMAVERSQLAMDSHETIDATGWYARIVQHEIDHLKGSTLHRPYVESELLFRRAHIACPVRALNLL